MEQFSFFPNTDPAQRKLPLSYEHQMLRAERQPLGEWEAISHYERPRSEYRALFGEVGLLDVSWLSFIKVTGPDRFEILQRLCTADMNDFETKGGTRRTLFLDDAGHVICDLEASPMGDALLLVGPPHVPPDRVMNALQRKLLLEDVDLQDITGEMAAAALLGPNANWVLREFNIAPPSAARGGMLRTEIDDVPVHVFRSSYIGNAAIISWQVGASNPVWKRILSSVMRFDGLPVGFEAFNPYRMERGLLWLGYDFPVGQLSPEEAGLEYLVNAGKKNASFPGLTACVQRTELWNPPRRLCGLILDCGRPPKTPRPMRFHDGVPAGEVINVATSYRLNKVVGTGIIKYSDPLPVKPLVIEDPESTWQPEAQAVRFPFPGMDADWDSDAFNG